MSSCYFCGTSELQPWKKRYSFDTCWKCAHVLDYLPRDGQPRIGITRFANDDGSPKTFTFMEFPDVQLSDPDVMVGKFMFSMTKDGVKRQVVLPLDRDDFEAFHNGDAEKLESQVKECIRATYQP